MKRADLTGQTFGRLTVLSMSAPSGEARAICSCACGGQVTALAYNVRNGNTSSCGCLAREHRVRQGKALGPIQGKKNATHGMSKTPTYISWLDARKRCFSPQNKRFSEYGARGITMSPQWAGSFETFLADMGKKPSDRTLDRIDVNGNYEPGNCRWATSTEQAQNTRTCVADWETVREIRRLRAEGAATLDLADRFGMSRSNVQMIVSGATWKEQADARREGWDEGLRLRQKGIV